MWFQKLFGFYEQSPGQVREQIVIDGELMSSRKNGKSYRYGRLETPTLADLRLQVRSAKPIPGKLTLREVVADAGELHGEEANAGALFQVASQFNLLEMASSDVTPEEGVDIYENDHTQGPACAVACGAGTVYRNYFAGVNGRTGQSKDNQIDCLSDIGLALDNTGNRLWEMKNGYALATEEGLGEIKNKLSDAREVEIDNLRGLLRIGIQWDTEVTIPNAGHTVTQAYCSALPVGYSSHPQELWAEFARLILDATYEATFCAAALNSLKTGNNKMYLTLVGGGVFENKTEWILGAIHRSIELYKDVGLDVNIVSYGKSNENVKKLIQMI